MRIELGPTGSLIKGDILDSNKAALENALKYYDAQLYLSWNPKKNHGWGSWELRRRPDKKTIASHAVVGNATYFLIDYKENEFENCIKDLPVLDYRIVSWVKRCDLWKQANYERGKGQRVEQWTKNLEHLEATNKVNNEDKTRKEFVYNMLQFKTAIKQYREAINSGTNPAEIAKFWK